MKEEAKKILKHKERIIEIKRIRDVKSNSHTATTKSLG
jgi:hypothetical protein